MKATLYLIWDKLVLCLKTVKEKLYEWYFWVLDAKADWDEVRKKR